MEQLAFALPEYRTVMDIYGVGKTYGPHLIAESGDVSRFTHRDALTAFVAWILVWTSQVSKAPRSVLQDFARHCSRSLPLCSRMLRQKIRFIASLTRKGKPYYVYMTAGANKFLLIYYGKVMRNLDQAE